MMIVNSLEVPKQIDVAIIGAGISGLGAALAIQAVGHSVALFERGSLAAGASNNSLRIIHGGFRYLQKLDLARVLESRRAQAELLQRYPEHIQPLSCLMPLAATGLKSRLPITLASALYSGCSRLLFPSLGIAKVLPATALPEVSLLEGQREHGVLQWEDALLQDPKAFAQQLATEVLSAGGLIFEHCPTTAVQEHGRKLGITLLHQGREQHVEASHVVDTSGNAVGTLGMSAQRLSGAEPWPRGWCVVFNVILRKLLQAKYAVAAQSPSGRLYFVVPRGEHSAIGSGQLKIDGRDSPQVIPESVLAEFLADFQRAFPSHQLKIEDIQYVEWGVLPSRTPLLDGNLQKLYGRAEFRQRGRLIEVLSTKYTTFLPQGRRIAKLLDS